MKMKLIKIELMLYLIAGPKKKNILKPGTEKMLQPRLYLKNLPNDKLLKKLLMN